MHRLSDMVGKPVLSAASGDKLGTVTDALVDTSAVAVVGLVVRHGVLAKERVLPLEELQAVGRDAVLARTDERLMNSREWREADITTTRSSALLGRRVVTAGGEQVGEVSDIHIVEGTGAFGGLEIESHSLAGLRTHRRVLSAAAEPRIGPDAVIVRDEALREEPRDEALREEPREEALREEPEERSTAHDADRPRPEGFGDEHQGRASHEHDLEREASRERRAKQEVKW